MEESQEVKPVKQDENKPARDEKGRLLPGNTANPNGRPKGKTLKEYQAEKFRLMTDEEKEKYLADVSKELAWKMAEGNPKNDLELNAKVTMADVIKDLEYETRTEAIGQIVEVAALVQDTGQEEKPNDVQPEPSPTALPAEQVVEKYNPQE